MREGLRFLPWLQRQFRDDRSIVEHLADCSECKKMTTQIDRQEWGCGYEQPLVGLRVRPWKHGGCPGADPTACPGYTTKLPEVAEVARARMHAKNGMARDFLGGPASENVMRGIEILEAADNDATFWRPPEQPK